MKNSIDKKLKVLFDYQKFEGDPKLAQTIKDSLNDESTLLSDLQLMNVTAGSNIVQIEDTCPICGNKEGYIHIYNKETHKEKKFCFICNYSQEDNKNSI